ncbi:MAG: hypothetical protein ACR2IP_04655 [Solirubrobacteraceae bacterium]
MERSQPQPPDPDQAREALRRLDRASDAAARLIAAARAGGAGGAADGRGETDDAGARDGADADGDLGERREIPPAGWQAPDEEGPSTHRAADAELLELLVQSLCALVPAELQHRLAQALREFLLALRALIDSCLEALEHQERQRSEPVEVQDIPIL